MATTKRAIALLAASGHRLTLVDVGASLEPFLPFQPLLGQATYVGFDPDLREIHHRDDGSGKRIMVDKAVVVDPEASTVKFFLTRNPTCSSTLPPRSELAKSYVNAYRFEVVGTEEVEATTLDAAMDSVGVERIDWIKLDTQGTDLRLLRSLGAARWATLMAVDAEPGFDQHYEGEDTFGDLHREMLDRGYWLADLVLTQGVRLRPEVFDESFRARRRPARLAYEFNLKGSPTAAGPRYLRTVESLERSDASREDYLRLWACAFASGNHPYALDVVAACEKAHGSDGDTAALRALTVGRNRRDVVRNAWRLGQRVSLRNVRRLISKPY
ncbi:MAG TPA: FkbM family methyltransferase [Acidimicrobiales bacterium]|nr:FkbM family methyltransferase [Acidimicrobiales bacterium]